MKNKLIFYIIGLVMLFSCQSEDLDMSLGDNYINSQTTIALVDTISLDLSSFRIDSIPTSGSGYLMSGSYTDEYYGTIKSSGYFQIDMPSAIISEEEEFDSLVLYLPYSGIAYGDTLQTQTINVHRVLEDIEPADEDTYIYNSRKFKYDPVPVGTATITPRPNFHDNIEIRLDDDLGREFLALLNDEEDQIATPDDFLDFFHGFALVPGDENNSVLSFSADSSLKAELYTHVAAENKIENTYRFQHDNASREHFNNITDDYSGTPLDKLDIQKNNIPSEEMGNMAFLQGGMGVVTRINYPGISKILEVEHKNILYSAELVLRPVPSSEKQIGLPANLLLYNTDKYNNIVSEITNEDGSSRTATLNYDEFYNENTSYTFDITDIIYEELSDGFVSPENGLLVMMPGTNFQGTLDRVIFDTRNGSQYRPILKLYYVFYD